LTTERLTFSKMSDRMKPQRYPYTLESLQRWAKWQQQGMGKLQGRNKYLLPALLFGPVSRSSRNSESTIGPSREPSLPSNANPVSINSPGTPAEPAASSKTSTMTPPSMTPPSPSIAAILSGWMADGASGDTGRNGEGAAPDGEPDPHNLVPWEAPWGECDWGYCKRDSVAWRFDDNSGRMLPVCGLHMEPHGGSAS